ncbi:MAG: PLP-dependent aminotransferase family protein, partial [Methanobacteriota archaeon]
SDNDLIVLEDDPYGELRYVGDDVRPIKSFDDKGRVVYMSTFSKILAPGLRVGWTAADPEILRKLIIAKQSSDVCTNVLGQAIAHEYIAQGHIDPQVERIREIYGRKLSIMVDGMKRFMPEELRWVPPEGGMFLWATLPEGLSSAQLLKEALEERVAFVSGRAFFPNPDDGDGALRLNFTYPSDDMIEEGLHRLGGVFARSMRR